MTAAGPLRVQAHAADLGACGHYRLIWPAELLAITVDGLELDLLDPDNAREAFDMIVDQDATAAAHGADWLDRLNAGTFDQRDAVLGDFAQGPPPVDVVVLQRPLTRQLVHVIGQLQRHGIAVVVETDDDFDSIHPRNVAHRTVDPRIDPHRNRDHLAAAAELADLVVVTTPALAKRYGGHGRVQVIPNYVPARYLHTIPPPRPPGDTSVRVGWSGSLNTHPGDLETIAGPIGGILARHGLAFHHIGEPDQARIRQALNLPDEVRYATTGEWLPLGQYPTAMAMLDVGLVPLALTPFNEAKSWLKGLEFAAVGVPFIAAPTGPYVELSEQHGIGIIARNRREWRDALEYLVTDADYRFELGELYRARARTLTLETHAQRWLIAWQNAYDNRRTP